MDYNDPIVIAAQIIMNRKANESNAEWLKAYNDVVSVMGRVYRQYGVRADPGRETIKESQIFRQIIAAVELNQMAWETVRKSAAEYESIKITR